MVYNFDTKEAEEYGVDEAIIIWNLRYWILHNKANNKNHHEGRTWTYNSYEAFMELFPFWSKNQIRHRLDSLIEAGVILKDNFNENKYNHTNWYAFKDEDKFLTYDMLDFTDRSDKNNSSSYSTNNKTQIDTQKWVDFWNEVNDAECRKTPKKPKQIRQRLKVYTEEELKTAIKNRAASSWINGEGRKYKTDWNSFWRNDEKVERYLNLDDKPLDQQLQDLMIE